MFTDEEILKIKSLLSSNEKAGREAAPAPVCDSVCARTTTMVDIKAGIRSLGLEGSPLIYPEPKQVRHFVACVAEFEKSDQLQVH